MAVNFNTKETQFMTYFAKVWIGLKNQRRPDLPRKQPMFKIELWNKYNAVLTEQNLTNNLCESWNSWAQYANIWVVIDKLRKEESLARSKIMAISPTSNKPDHKRRVEQRRKKALKQKEIVQKFNTMPINDYMTMVGGFYNF